MNLYKQIPYFSDYAISDNGVLYRIADFCFIEPVIYSGYKNYTLINDSGLKQSISTHRLVAMTYLGIPDGYEKLMVNHINGNKLDNRAINLEWCTARENMLHAGYYGLTTKWIPIQVRNVITEEVMEFESFLACAKHFGLSKDAIAWRVNAGEHRVDELFNQYRPISRKDTWVTPTEWDCGILLRNAFTGEVKVYESQNAVCREYGVSPAFLSLRMTDERQPLFRLHDELYQIGINQHNKVWTDHGDPYLWFEQNTQNRFVVMYNPSLEGRRIFFTLVEAGAAYGFKKNVPFWRAKRKQFTPWHDGLICHYLFNH